MNRNFIFECHDCESGLVTHSVNTSWTILIALNRVLLYHKGL